MSSERPAGTADEMALDGKVRIALVDDHPTLIRGIKALLDEEVRFEVVTIDQAHDLRREWLLRIRRRLAQIEAGREANARRQS